MDPPSQLQDKIGYLSPSDVIPVPSHSHTSPWRFTILTHAHQTSNLYPVLTKARRNLNDFVQERLECIQRAKASLEEQFDFDAVDDEERSKSKRDCETAMRLGRGILGNSNAARCGGQQAQVVVVKSSKAEARRRQRHRRKQGERETKMAKAGVEEVVSVEEHMIGDEAADASSHMVSEKCNLHFAGAAENFANKVADTEDDDLLLCRTQADQQSSVKEQAPTASPEATKLELRQTANRPTRANRTSKPTVSISQTQHQASSASPTSVLIASSLPHSSLDIVSDSIKTASPSSCQRSRSGSASHPLLSTAMSNTNKSDTSTVTTTSTVPTFPAAAVQTTTSTIYHPQRPTHLSFQLQPSYQRKTDKNKSPTPTHSPTPISVPLPNPIKDFRAFAQSNQRLPRLGEPHAEKPPARPDRLVGCRN